MTMEMQEVSSHEGEKTAEDEGVKEKRPLLKPQEETKQSPYSELQGPSENIYAEAPAGGDPGKLSEGPQADGSARVYRFACLLLTFLCLILLLVVIILSIKLHTGSTACAETEENSVQSTGAACSYQSCQTFYGGKQYRPCRQCPYRWLTFGRSCFYLSTLRLTWEESQRNCSNSGGSLAVISSQEVQNFLTGEGKRPYWIGLRWRGHKWTWVNNTAVEASYWGDASSEGDCAFLNSKDDPKKNWLKAPCEATSYYICQL